MGLASSIESRSPRACSETGSLKDLAGLGSTDLDPAGVREIQQVLVATGAREHVEATIDELVDDALAGLDAAPLAGPARAALTDLASYVAYRDR